MLHLTLIRCVSTRNAAKSGREVLRRRTISDLLGHDSFRLAACSGNHLPLLSTSQQPLMPKGAIYLLQLASHRRSGSLGKNSAFRNATRFLLLLPICCRRTSLLVVSFSRVPAGRLLTSRAPQRPPIRAAPRPPRDATPAAMGRGGRKSFEARPAIYGPATSSGNLIKLRTIILRVSRLHRSGTPSGKNARRDPWDLRVARDFLTDGPSMRAVAIKLRPFLFLSASYLLPQIKTIRHSFPDSTSQLSGQWCTNVSLVTRPAVLSSPATLRSIVFWCMHRVPGI